MAKFHGKIGYAEFEETSPGVYTETIVERDARGDVTRMARILHGGDVVNDNISFNNEVSVVCDAYAIQHFSSIRYVLYMGTKWKVSNVTVQRPRLILNFGGVYND